jgi:hypothetical protein
VSQGPSINTPNNIICCPPPKHSQVADRAPLVRDRAEYERLYKWSLDDPQDFWANMAQDYFWAKKVGGPDDQGGGGGGG